jgi:NOL1/NOP2/sun family putative RNA methylase
MKNIFKERFIERYRQLTDWEAFKVASLKYLRRAIRVNTLKISVSNLKKRLEKEWALEQIPWIREGFWITNKYSDRRDIGNLKEHMLGYFYVQEAASMIPPLLLDVKPGDFVLDCCSAPGSKTTQMGAMLKGKGFIIANELTGSRIAPLSINLQRSLLTNNIITNADGSYFKDFQFDKILVDAPCSGTGTIRKSYKVAEMWNPDMVKRLSKTQKRLITTAFENLKPNGVLVYSTCTMEPEENEEVIDFLLNRFSNAAIEEINLKGLKRSKPILNFEGKRYNNCINKALRIWPQDNDTEGFFVAKIRKVI